MKLKKLLYSIATASIIAPVAIGSFNSSTAKASSNEVTKHDVKTKTYYGQKAIGYYGFKHAGGFWKTNRNLKSPSIMYSNDFSFYQAGGGGSYKVKGNYVQFNQSSMAGKRKNLNVKISTVLKYANNHGGKYMLKNIKTIGTSKQIKDLYNSTNNQQSSNSTDSTSNNTDQQSSNNANNSSNNINSTNNQSSQNKVFNKTYTADEASQILEQKFVDIVNAARSSNAKQPWILNDKFSKLADSRAQSYIKLITSGVTGAASNFEETAGNGDGTMQKGAYVDGVQLGIFPDDTSISDNITETTEDFGLLSGSNGDQIHYSDISDAITELQNFINNSDGRSQDAFNDGGNYSNLIGNAGNGQNYYGLSIKPYGYNNSFVLEVITSDINY